MVYLPAVNGPNQIPTPVPTPNPLARECDNLEQHPERSLLVNTGFDDGFDDSGSGKIWFMYNYGISYFEQETEREFFGGAGVKLNGARAFRAGLYQTTTKMLPGSWYHAFYATAQKVWGGPDGAIDGSLPILREVGVDPTGGTDPSSRNIIWGRQSGGQPDKDAKLYGGWKTLGNGNNPLVSFIATSRQATVFVQARGWDDVVASNTWIDSVYLTRACQNGYRQVFDGP